MAQALTPFGAFPDLQGISFAPPFIFVGNAGRNPQTALQRGNYTNPVDGYLAEDVNSNYTFTQMDFVRYDVKLDGSITVGEYDLPGRRFLPRQLQRSERLSHRGS